MKHVVLVFTVLGLSAMAGPGWASINLDGILDEWTGSNVVNLGTWPAPDTGSYTLLATWDASNLYIGVDRDSSDRYLGDTGGDNDSFFLAIDVDGVAGSGAGQDGYGRMDFAGTMLPDMIYYYAGGGGWYESGTWNGGGWDWNGWTNANSYYGWQEDNPNDELCIPLADIGGSHEVMAWAWMTREAGDFVETSWPDGTTGGDPNPVMTEGFMIPEPATISLLGMGSLLAGVIRRRK